MRVTAIQSLKKGVLYSYGEGEYIGDLVPDTEPFASAGIPNPCVKLDTGKYIWGFECWWMDITKFNKNYAPAVKETIMVESDNIQPKSDIG